MGARNLSLECQPPNDLHARFLSRTAWIPTLRNPNKEMAAMLGCFILKIILFCFKQLRLVFRFWMVWNINRMPSTIQNSSLTVVDWRQNLVQTCFLSDSSVLWRMAWILSASKPVLVTSSKVALMVFSIRSALSIEIPWSPTLKRVSRMLDS